ncbi:MAG: hypothetical protein ACKOFW_03945, partial [Planctomycetaceae bacterium]
MACHRARSAVLRSWSRNRLPVASLVSTCRQPPALCRAIRPDKSPAPSRQPPTMKITQIRTTPVRIAV